jgi:hypothetical protein
LTAYLWSDAGSRYVLSIEAAIRSGVRPTTMILGEDNRKAWSDLDVLVMLAYEGYKSEQCSQCGHPRWLCRNEDPRLQVKIKQDDCYAKQQITKYEESHKDDSDKVPVYPVFYSTDNRALVEFRSVFREQEAAARAEEAEDDEDG